jgi:tetratricopeptide (TPR) repeat protein
MAMDLDSVVSRHGDLKATADELAGHPPMGPQFLTRVGQAYTMLGAHDEAEKFLRRAADAMPYDGNAQYHVGAALNFLGRFEEARARLLEAVRLQPRHHPAYYSLADIETQTPERNYIRQLEALFPGPDPVGHRTLHVGHALAKTYEDLGDYGQAFDWLVKGKAIRRVQADYSSAREDELFAEAPATATAGRLPGHEDGTAIFIGGMPRSGTTLVEAILSAHPDVTAGGEPGMFPALVKHISGGGDRNVLDPRNLRETRDIDLGRLGRGYMDAVRPIGGGTPRFTDKTPLNVLYAGLILRALPNARVITLRRDPMDSVISFFRTMFVATPHVYPSVYDLETAARHYVHFHRLADHWREALPADRYREVRYEELVADPEGEIRSLLDFAGLPFEPAVLDFHNQSNVVATASAVQVRKPIYNSALGRWKRYGDKLDPAAKILTEAGIDLG